MFLPHHHSADSYGPETDGDYATGTVCSSPTRLQQPLNRYPASRWQQLKQSIGITSTTQYGTQANPSTHQTRERNSSDGSLYTDGLQQVQQEAADVLRRCADTGAALLSQELQSAASVLAAALQASDKDQFCIQPDGSICCSSAAAQHKSQLAEQSFGSNHTTAGSSSAWPVPPDFSLTATEPDSSPTMDKSPPRVPTALKQLAGTQLQQRHQHVMSNCRPKVSHGPAANTLKQLLQTMTDTSSTVAHSSKPAAHKSSASLLLRRSHGMLGHERNVHAFSSSSSPTSCSKTAIRPRSATAATILSATSPSTTAVAARPAELSPLLLWKGSLSQSQELSHDLAVMLARKLLRCWQQCTADIQLEKARARPMQRLLCKRKALRAWRAATQQTATSAMAEAVTALQSDVVVSDASPAQQPQGTELQQQDATAQQQQQLSRREEVAVQFHKMYCLHSCIAQWRNFAVAAVLAKRMAETDSIVAQQQEELARKQQELERKHIQQQLRQQEQKRLAVAHRFRQMYILHRAFTSWHKAAAMAAALSKLHPPVAAAPGGQVHVPLAATAPGSSRGDVDTTVVMQAKAQQLLLRLAGKQQQQQGMPQQQTLQPVQTQIQQRQCSGLQGCTTPAEDVRLGDAGLHKAASAVAEDVDLLLQCLTALQVQPGPAAASAATAQGNIPVAATQVALAPVNCAKVATAVPQVAKIAEADVELQAEVSQKAIVSARSSEPAAVSQCIAACASSPAVDVPGQTHVVLSNAELMAMPELYGGQYASADNAEPQHALNRPCSLQRNGQQQGLDDVVMQHPSELHPQEEHEQQQEASTDTYQQEAKSGTATHQTCKQKQVQPKQQPPEEQQQQQQQQPYTGNVDRQQLQQHLRQLLAAEQRKQREEQRREQQLRYELSIHQSALAAMHYKLVLVRRLGLVPWQAVRQLRQQQEQVAANWRAVGLMKAAILVWKQLLYQRHKRHVCSHIKAIGKLQQLHQQQRQRKVLTALSAWALARQQYRRQLVVRVLAAWRDEVSSTRALLQQCHSIRQARTQQAVIKLWKQVTEEQAQEQLMLELELNVVATTWRHKRQQRFVLLSWHHEAAAAAQDREQAAKQQETWGKVQGWLSDMKANKQGSICADQGSTKHTSGDNIHHTAHSSVTLCPAVEGINTQSPLNKLAQHRLLSSRLRAPQLPPLKSKLPEWEVYVEDDGL